MTTIKFRDWKLIVDKQATKLTYDEATNGSAESCNCTDCKNFVNYGDKVYPDDIKQLFIDLGIDLKKESEVVHYYRQKDGLHFYGGWFHFKGQFIGKDCAVGSGVTFDLTPITDNFSIGFHVESHLAFCKNKEDLVQIEFQAIIPWTIDKELESE